MDELIYKNYYREANNLYRKYLIDYSYDEYFINKYKLLLKYQNTTDIELKLKLDYIKNDYKYKIYLYFIISSYFNQIVEYYYKNSIYYNEKDQEERLINYNNYIKSLINKLKEGLKLNITVPYLICVKFMNQIKNLNKELYDFIKNDYLKKCRKTIGLCHLPKGKMIYKILIKKNLGGLNKTPEQIHNLGLSLLSKINKNVNKKQDFFTSREELFKECNEIILKIYMNYINKYFHYKPIYLFKLRELPEKLEKSSSVAYYDYYKDIIYINLSYYKEITKQSLFTILIHEYFHQYHYQYMRFYKLENYQIYGYNNTTFIEGFAHYMETYCDDYDDNDNGNDYLIMRKLRLVVDTGIHYYGWSYKKAFNYMIKYLPHKRNDIIIELDRYMCYPTQALSYVMGKLEIIKMRDKFLKEKKGSIKDFHHKLLINGTVSFLTLHKIFN
jgi:uncharacterized protein (DUF885 family)